MKIQTLGSIRSDRIRPSAAVRVRKVLLFVALTYAMSWTVALLMYLSGIRYGSLPSFAMVAVLYMPAPAYATLIVQKLIAREPLAAYGLSWRSINWRWLLVSIVGVWLLVLGTFTVIGLFGNVLGIAVFGRVDWSAAAFADRIAALTGGQAVDVPIPPIVIFALAFVQATLAGLTINLVFAFGEELGWRGLLLHETQPLGFWRSNLLIGVIWGLWHAPIILQGHNYPGHPVSGVAMMTLWTISLSFIFAYSRLRTRSIWGPSAMHGVLNGLGGLPALFVIGSDPLWGSVPGVAGVVAGLALTAAIVLFDRSFVRSYRELRR